MQNLETAVRKNIEIQQVAKNYFSTLLNLGQFSGEQQHHQDNQVQTREVGEDTGVRSINFHILESGDSLRTFFLLSKVLAKDCKFGAQNEDTEQYYQ